MMGGDEAMETYEICMGANLTCMNDLMNRMGESKCHTNNVTKMSPISYLKYIQIGEPICHMNNATFNFHDLIKRMNGLANSIMFTTSLDG